jgi:hypothetical protein
MIVDRLCRVTLSLIQCRDLAITVGANHAAGTDMRLLAPAIAEQFHLTVQMTDDTAQLAHCLHHGGAAIVNVGGDRSGYTGTFSRGGHYIVALQESSGEFCLLDPSWTPDKYSAPPRSNRVRTDGKLLYTSWEVLQQDTENRTPAYYLFTL